MGKVHHIAGKKVDTGRIMRPDDARLGTVPRSAVCRPSTGYTTAFEAATPILEARHTYEELKETPIIDKGALTLFGSNWQVMECVRDKDLAKLAAYVAWGLRCARGYCVKIVNPGGCEAWGFGANVKGLNDPVPGFDVTPAEILRRQHSRTWGRRRLSRSCQSWRHNLHRRQHLSARCRDEQRNYNCKGRGKSSAQLPEDKDCADRWSDLPKVCMRPG